MIHTLIKKIRRRPLEEVSLSVVYSEILGKVYVLGIAFTIAYFQSIYIEWGLKNRINFVLSAIELGIAIAILGISLTYKKIFSVAPFLTRSLYFLLVIIEIETGFHDLNIPYFDPKNWLTIIALVGVCSFFYPGKVWQFVLEWSILLIYYFIRVFIENNQGIPLETWRESTTIIPLFIVCFFLNHWWFRTRYVAAFRGVLLDEHKKNIFQEMNESLGSQLTEITFISNKFVANPTIINNDELSNLKNLCESALNAFRSQIHEEDQKEILRVSFLDGLRLILKKRYKNVGRNVKFEWDTIWNETNIRLVDKDAAHNLFIIFTEITSIDLNYSRGLSTWKLSIEPKVFWFIFSSGFQSLTVTENENSPIFPATEIGKSEQALKVRAESFGGSLSISRNPFSIQLLVPAKLFQWE